MLKLTCTADDMIPFAKACEFAGSRGDGVQLWKEAERAELRAELDAAYFLLYGIERDDVEYILTTFTNTGLIPEEERGTQQRMWERSSPGELILECYDRLAAGEEWQPRAPEPEPPPEPAPPTPQKTFPPATQKGRLLGSVVRTKRIRRTPR